MSATAAPRPTLQDWFTGLGPTDQVRFLLAVAHELTIVARGYYVPQSDALADAAAVRAVNEIQHRVVAHAAAILEDPAAGRDPVAYGWLEGVPERGGLPGWVAAAVRRAAAGVRGDRGEPSG
jgi:hypothetical protein